MTLLITGIHGFVGSNLVAALKGKHRIYGLDIVAHEKEGVVHTYAWEEVDDLPEIDAIIHLAGKAHDTKNRTEKQVYFDINTKLTERIFDYFVSSSAKQFIYFSSVKAAADRVVGDVLTEEVLPAPKGPYGESKIAAENYINGQLSILNSPFSIKKVYILRPCMIHGPGNKGNLNLLYKVVSKGIPWPLGAFENRRSFTSIDNLCYVIDRLLAGDIASGTYHIGDDEALSTNELIALLCETMDKKPRIWKLNRKLMSVCAAVGTILHLPLNTERLNKLTENYIVSNRKIKHALGIEHLPVRAKEGLKRTIQSFLSN
jgi:nucleoside-diphosphate-sugar epimerase